MKGLFLFVTCWFAGLSHYAQVSGNAHYNNTQTQFGTSAVTYSSASKNEIAFDVNGLYNVLAADLVVTFSMVQVGETALAADELMNARIALFTNGLKGIGVDTSKIRVDMVSFVPKYDYDTTKRLFSKSYNEVPVGFELQKNIMIHYTRAEQLDAIISAAAAAEIYDLVKVDYFVADIEKKYAELRDKCVLELKARLKSYEALGFKLDTVHKSLAESYLAIYPPGRYLKYQAFSRASLNAVRKKNTHVTSADKTTTQYYSAVDQQQYDLIVNPTVAEPMVQLSYTLSVKYYIKHNEPQYIHVVTPAGDLKQIQVK